MAVSVTQRSRTFVVDDCRFAGSRGRVLLKSPFARHDDLLVVIEHVGGAAIRYDSSGIQENRPRAEGTHRRQVMRHKQDRGTGLLQILEAAQATMLEDCIANGKRLVDYQNVRLYARGNGERQSNVHA